MKMKMPILQARRCSAGVPPAVRGGVSPPQEIAGRMPAPQRATRPRYHFHGEESRSAESSSRESKVKKC
jgi:hypothetical protein